MTFLQEPSQVDDGHAAKGWRRFGDGALKPTGGALRC